MFACLTTNTDVYTRYPAAKERQSSQEMAKDRVETGSETQTIPGSSTGFQTLDRAS